MSNDNLAQATKKLLDAVYLDWPNSPAVRSVVLDAARAVQKALNTHASEQAQAAEPVMIYHGRCTIDCGEHGHNDTEMLKLIPAGTKLYTSPQALAPEQEREKFEEAWRAHFQVGYYGEPKLIYKTDVMAMWQARAALAGGAK